MLVIRKYIYYRCRACFSFPYNSTKNPIWCSCLCDAILQVNQNIIEDIWFFHFSWFRLCFWSKMNNYFGQMTCPLCRRNPNLSSLNFSARFLKKLLSIGNIYWIMLFLVFVSTFSIKKNPQEIYKYVKSHNLGNSLFLHCIPCFVGHEKDLNHLPVLSSTDHKRIFVLGWTNITYFDGFYCLSYKDSVFSNFPTFSLMTFFIESLP